MLKFNLKKENKFLLILFMSSFILRILFFIFFIKDSPVLWNFDSKHYVDVASQIALGNGIVDNDGSSHFYRVPGYSIFLAATSFTGNFNYSLLIQIFLASFIPILIFYLSKILFSNNKLLPYVAAIFSSFHLGFVLFAGLAMTESLFLILFLLFLIFFYKQKYFLSGLLLGLASMFRPVGHYLIIVSIFFIFILYKNKIKNSILIFIGWLIIILPWLLRNFLLTGVLFFSTLPGIHFLKHSAARICMEIENITYSSALNKVSIEWQDLIKDVENKTNKKLNPVQVCNLAEKISISYFLNDIFVTAKHIFINMFKTCFSLYSAELLFLDTGKLPEYSVNRGIKSILSRFLLPDINNKFLILIIYLEIFIFLFLLLGFAGFILSSLFIKEYLYVLLKTFPFIFMFLFISLSCGFARLRLPIEPFLIVLAIEFWLKFFKERKLIYYD